MTDPTPPTPPTPPVPPAGPARPLRVLQVEDAATDAELILVRLKRLGYRVESRRAWTEESFIDALAAFAPELILSDYSMPTFDGLRALELARTLSPGVPFIFVSGTIDPRRVEIARANGAADYLPKDDLALLGVAVERALAAARRPAP